MARKPKYQTPEAMEAVIERYFEDCEEAMKPPTITGLALALGFTGRQALLDYQGRAAFADTVTRAKSRVEEYAEQRLYDRDGQRGAEFSLKYNFRWTQGDKTDGAEDAATGVVLLPVVMPTSEPPGDEEDG